MDEERRKHWKDNVNPLYLSSIGEFPLHAKVAFLWTFCPLGFHGLGKGTNNSGVNFLYNLFKNLPVIMLELWMSTSYACDNPMGRYHNLQGEAGRQNRELLCKILLFLREKGIKIVLMSRSVEAHSDHKHPLLHLVDDVYRHPCGIVAPQPAINNDGIRKDFRALVKKYAPLAGATNALTPNQIKVLISDALDSALATHNQHDFQPDTPVDGRAKASPAGTKWPKVAAAMEKVDIDLKPTTKKERAAEKAQAKKLTEPRLYAPSGWISSRLTRRDRIGRRRRGSGPRGS
jgi:hypothetical protein